MRRSFPVPTEPEDSYISRRHGLSAVEVVAIAIVVLILIVLFLPNLEQSRESARLMQCRNNLKQIGLAIHNYHEQFKVFPPGYVANIDVRQKGLGTGDPVGYALGWGWAATIIPNVFSSSLPDKFIAQPLPEHGNATWYNGLPQSQKGSELTATSLPVYRCPSDNGSHVVAQMPVMNDDGSMGAPCEMCYGRSNYLGVAGWFVWSPETKTFVVERADTSASGWSVRTDGGIRTPIVDPLDLTPGTASTMGPRYIYAHAIPPELRGQAVVGKGSFGENSQVSIRDMLDGTAHTYMIGERCTPTNNSGGEVGNGIWAGVTHRGDATGRAGALGDTNLPLNYGNGNPAIKLNYSFCPNTTGFMSYHSRGANFVHGDGSVRFISESIELSIYRRYSMIDDGHLTGAF